MKILVLHGYAQSGDTFRRKIRRLEKRLLQTSPGAKFVYLDGPIKLQIDDIPELKSADFVQSSDKEHDMRAWFDLRAARDPPNGLHISLAYLAAVLKTQGPFDGMIAFSQGTVIGAMVASLLQGITSRQKAYDSAFQQSTHILEYPQAFSDISHPPFKFALFYASRVGIGAYSDWMYRGPLIETPFCHFFGQLDSMVSHEERDEVLAKLCSGKRSRVVMHAGGHFVATDNNSINQASTFVKDCLDVASDPCNKKSIYSADQDRDCGLGTFDTNGLVAA